MGLRFVIGPSGSGKTFHIYDSISRLLKDKDTNVVLIVPDQATYQAERSILSRHDLKGFMNLYIYSFRRLSRKILMENPGVAYPFITQTGKSMALQACLWKHQKDLTIFSRLVNLPGFRKALGHTLSEVRSHGISLLDMMEALSASLPEGSFSSDLLWQKLHDLSIVYGEYSLFLKDHFFDPDDFLDLACSRIRESSFVKSSVFFIDGFSGFTPQEYRLVKAILKTANHVTMALCLDETELERPISEMSVFHPTREVYDRISRFAEETGTPIEPNYILKGEAPNRFLTAPLLAEVEKSFRRFPCIVPKENTSTQSKDDFSGLNDTVSKDTAKVVSGPAAEIVALPNPRGEVEFLAREILHLVRDKGLCFRDITVEVRDLIQYGDLIALIFGDHKIPFFLDRKRSLSHHPLAELIRSVLDMVRKNLDFDSVMRFLKTDLVPISRDMVDKLENLALAHGIRGPIWLDEKPWKIKENRLIKEEDYDDMGQGCLDERDKEAQEDMGKIDDARKKAFSSFREFYRFCSLGISKKNLTARSISQALLDLISALGVRETLEAFGQEAEESLDVEAALEHSRIFEQVTNMLEEAKEILGDEALDFGTYVALIEAGLEDLEMGVIPPTLDQVFVAALDRSRQPECRVTFLIGAQEGAFPKKQEEDSIFLDKDRERLESLGIDLEPSSRLRQLHENYLVYVAFTRPREKLYITYPLGNQAGKALSPSYIIGLLRKRFPEITHRSIALEAEGEDEDSLNYVVPGRVLGYVGRKLYGLKKGVDPGPLWREVYRYLVSNLDKSQVETILGSIAFKNTVKPLERELARNLYGVPLYMSVSKLERYAACPFSYFAGTGLGLRERDVLKLDPKGLGTFFHEAMRVFLASLVPHLGLQERRTKDVLAFGDFSIEEARKSLSGIELDKMKAHMKETVERLVAFGPINIFGTSPRLSHVPYALKGILERSTTILYETFRLGQFVPCALEASFSFRTGEDVYLRGIVDRIDVFFKDNRLYFYIVDYKSSPRKLDLLDAFYGLSLQLLVYVLAAIRDFQGAYFGRERNRSSGETHEPFDVIPVGGLYFTIRDPFLRTEGPMRKEEAEMEGQRQLKMRGILLRDPTVLRYLDGITESWSSIYPFRFTRSGVQDGGSVLEQKDLSTVLRFAAQKIKESSSQILSGKIDINPFRKGTQRACQYCPYGAFCGFDILVDGNEYMVINKKPKEEILENMNASLGGAEHGR